MNKGYLILLFLLIITPVLCNKSIKEKFYNYPGYDKPKTLRLQDDSGKYTFTPYRMDFTRNLSQRGCETSKYWDCIDKHPLTKNGYEINKIPEKVQNDCKRYSSDQCYFPEFISHARTEPYYQYFQYV